MLRLWERRRALSSVGLERYPYKVDVIGSTPIAPTSFQERENCPRKIDGNKVL